MVILEGLWKTYGKGASAKCVARGLDVRFASGASIAILGRNGAGKSTLLRMIAGTLDPDRGRVVRHGSVSWPVGFAGSFHPDLTGAQNIRFVARVHGLDAAALVDFVENFAELGAHFHQSFRTYSSGMKARLAFGASMGVGFDTYLVDEVTAVGDAAFRRKSVDLLRDRLRSAGAFVVSHSMPLVRQLCTAGAVLDDGDLLLFDDLEAAIHHHEATMAA